MALKSLNIQISQTTADLLREAGDRIGGDYPKVLAENQELRAENEALKQKLAAVLTEIQRRTEEFNRELQLRNQAIEEQGKRIRTLQEVLVLLNGELKKLTGVDYIEALQK